MTFESTHALVEQVAQAVHELRITLENHALPGLETAILNSQMALKGLENHPGGVDGLKQLIATFPQEQQKQLNDRLAQARSDHHLNGELIRLAMQRNAALQAYAAQSSAGATYSSEGGVSFLGGGQLLGKFWSQHFIAPVQSSSKPQRTHWLSIQLNIEQSPNRNHCLSMQLANTSRR